MKKDQDKLPKEELPSAADDCADVNSAYERYKKNVNKSKFPPVEYEKPPHHIFHMKRELGDIMWYWTTACASLGLDPYEVISENQKKLEARYGERFEVDRSEVRKEGDL